MSGHDSQSYNSRNLPAVWKGEHHEREKRALKVTIAVKSYNSERYNCYNCRWDSESYNESSSQLPCFSIPSFFYGLKSVCFQHFQHVCFVRKRDRKCGHFRELCFKEYLKHEEKTASKKCDGGWKKHWHLRWHLKWSSEFSLVNPMYFSLVRSIPKYTQMNGIVFDLPWRCHKKICTITAWARSL